MSDYSYILDDRQGTRLHLSNEGVQTAWPGLVHQLKDDGFRHAEDRVVGSCMLHVFERPLAATDIVATEEPGAEQDASWSMPAAG